MKLFKRFHIPHSKKVTVSAAVAVGLALCLLCMVPRAAMAAAIQRDLPIYCVQKDSKVCSLTFDAAWGNEDTQQLIDILGKYNIKATFFVVGEWVDKYPESVKALHDAGHEIMNHSDNHPYFTKLSAEQIKTQLNTCNEKIAAITGVTPILFRPPYGDYNNRLIVTARSLGYTPIQWSVDSLDWKNRGRDDLVRRATENVQSGDIVLFHNDSDFIVDALPLVLESYREKGLTVVPVSRLLRLSSICATSFAVSKKNFSP